MKIRIFSNALAFLPVAFNFLSANDSPQCYTYPVGGKAPSALGESLESDYQMRLDYAQRQGADMQKWQDTAKFAFMVAFQSLGNDGPSIDPKDSTKPDPKPSDTLSPQAFQVWAQILFTQYEIYDYSDPGKRLSAPADPSDTFRPLLGTRTTILDISKECFVRVVDAGTPGKPAHLRRNIQGISGSKIENQRESFNAIGRQTTTAAPLTYWILFKK